MKRYIFSAIGILAASALLLVAVAKAQDATVNPFQALRDAVTALQERIAALEPKTADVRGDESAASDKGLIGFNYKKDMAYARIAATGFVDVSERTVTYEKKKDNSILQVTYDDSFGVTYRERGDCRWRLVVEDELWGKEKAFTPATAGGGALLTDRTSTSVAWIVEGLSKGFYHFQIQAKRGTAGSATKSCENGWQNDLQENSLMVEELLK